MTDSRERATDLVERYADQIAENDFQMTVEFMVGDMPRAMLLPRMDDDHDTSRAKLTWAVTALAASIPGLTEIVMAMDSYGVVGIKDNPTDKAGYPLKTDGTPFGPGEMQYAFVNKTADAHLVTEAVSVMTCSAESFNMTMVNYDRTPEGIRVSPDQPPEMEGAFASGGMALMMRSAFEAPKLLDLIQQDENAPSFSDFGLNENDALLHILCATVKQIMIRTQWPCMIGAANTDEQDLVKKSLNEGPLSGFGQVLTEDDIEEIVNLNEAWEKS